LIEVTCMFHEILEKIDSLGIFCDGLLVVDTEGYIISCRESSTNNPSRLYHTDELVGRHLFEAYPSLNASNSTLYKALRGVPTYNLLQHHVNFRGETFSTYETSMALKSDGKIIGAVSFTKFEDRLPSEIQLETSVLSETPVHEAMQHLVGDSLPMQMTKTRIHQISKSDASVLLFGATGTGKGVAARAIHQMSNRASRPFIEQNCAAIPANLLESLFFGTVKGSYTGATDTEGIFRQCNGGTLFLDEINSMDLNLQAKLLKVLESGKITPVGGKKTYEVNVRVIAATNEHPIACIESGNMRSDLFYRLSAVQLEMPPLSQRLSDIPLLCDHFIDFYRQTTGQRIFYIDSSVLDAFRQYSWPGNVRELKNLIEGAFVYADSDTIQLKDLPSYLFDPRWTQLTSGEWFSGAEAPVAVKNTIADQMLPEIPDDLPLKEAMAILEKQLLSQRMKQFKTKKALAENLGISRQALDVKLNKYNL